MLLFITGSRDGTADLLFDKLNDFAFRFNYDIFDEYQIIIENDYWKITNPAGIEISSNTAKNCFWWKAFNFDILHIKNMYLKEEIKYIYRELYSYFLLFKSIKGTTPYFHKKYGKLTLVKIAKEFFIVPDTSVGWGKLMKKTILKNKNIVAKSLTSGLITTDKDLFTTEVNLEKLDLNYPWYLQEKIEATDDITTFICGDNLFTFSRNRKELVGLDWRNQNDFFDDDQKWVPYELTKKEMNSIRSFAKKIRVEWGRIDFLKSNDELIFLEYNANGQFFFLDTKNQYGLKDAVVEYLRK
jgi:hypothetical protein